MKKKSVTKNLLSVAIGTLLASNISAQDNKLVFEEVLVTAEKRTESLQDLSQAITVLNGEDLDNRQISTFVDISAIAPGVNIAKNEGFKTVITIRGVGYETTRMLSQRLQSHTILMEFMLHPPIRCKQILWI